MTGASSLQVVTKVHLPNVVSYVNVIFTLSLIGSLSNFGLVAATTGRRAGNATMTPSMYMYKVAFGSGADFGYASAMGGHTVCDYHGSHPAYQKNLQ